MRRRLGKGAEDLFKKTEPDQAPEEREGKGAETEKRRRKPRGRKPEAPAPRQEATAKVTVLLTPSQIDFLDELCLSIRKHSGRSLRRTEVVRALVEALRSMNIDLRNVDSEEQLHDAILHRLD